MYLQHFGLREAPFSITPDTDFVFDAPSQQDALATVLVALRSDEAQAIPLDTLETLRLLSNLETGKRKLLQMVLFGQPELDTLLSLPPCRSLASRIAFAAQLAPLPRHRFGHYLQHRMVTA